MNSNLSSRINRILAVMVFAIVLVIPLSNSQGAKAKKDLKTSTPPPSSSVSVFALPRLFELPTKAMGHLLKGNDNQARSALKIMIRLFPFIPALEYDPDGVKKRRDVNKLLLEKLSQAFERSYALVKKIPQKNIWKLENITLNFHP